MNRITIDRRIMEELATAGFFLTRSMGSHAVFKNARGQGISVSKTPRNADTQLREVRRDIRRYQEGVYK